MRSLRAHDVLDDLLDQLIPALHGGDQLLGLPLFLLEIVLRLMVCRAADHGQICLIAGETAPSAGIQLHGEPSAIAVNDGLRNGIRLRRLRCKAVAGDGVEGADDLGRRLRVPFGQLQQRGKPLIVPLGQQRKAIADEMYGAGGEVGRLRQLEQQALSQVPRTDPGRVQRLYHKERLLQIERGAAAFLRQLVQRAVKIAVGIETVNEKNAGGIQTLVKGSDIGQLPNQIVGKRSGCGDILNAVPVCIRRGGAAVRLVMGDGDSRLRHFCGRRWEGR